MTRLRVNRRFVVALLLTGSATPLIGWAHSEGVEAADPATPPAVLSFSGAAGRYIDLDAKPREWRATSVSETSSGDAASGMDMHAGHAEHTPATHQQ